MAKILILCLVFLLGSPLSYADEAGDRKREIERLKKEAAQKENELKKYREQEQKISKEISALESRRANTQQLKSKVESDISYVEQNLLSAEDKRAALGRSIPLWQGVFGEELEAYYFTPSCPQCPGDYYPEQDIFVERMITHKAAFAAQLYQEKQAAEARIHSFEERSRKLLAQSSRIAEQQQKISQSFEEKKKDLDVTKRKAAAIRKEINELKKSATALNDWLASFERKRKAADKKAASSSKTSPASGPKINVPPHSLPWPVSGKVLSQFGKEYRADLNTWIFREGIKIAARQGEPVKAVSAGSVIYAGPFRSYGNVVILDHTKGFFTIYGFLQEIQVQVGDKLEQKGVLGTAGKDTQASSGTGQSAVYFEIRQGTVAVDPQPWLK